jgi:hypothetical protein
VQFFSHTDRLLDELIQQQRRIIEQQEETNHLLRRIARELAPEPVTGFTFTQENPMLPIDPGQTGIKFVATPTPAGAVLPTGAVLVWASNDPNVTAVADTTDTTGLTVDISIAAAATVGEAAIITLTATGTNADGSALNATGSFTLTVGAAPVQNVTGFTFAQTA